MSCRAVDLRTGPSKGLFAPFLHVLLHELFGVLLEHVVDLVEQGVQLLLELLALLGYLGRRLNVGLLGFLLAVRTPLLLGATTVLGHRPLLRASSMIVSRGADDSAWKSGLCGQRRRRWRGSPGPSTSPEGSG